MPIFDVGVGQGLGYCSRHETNQTERARRLTAVFRHADGVGPAFRGRTGPGR